MILTTPLPSLHIDVINYRNNFSTAGGVLTDTQLYGLNEFVNALYTNGLNGKILHFYPLIGDNSELQSIPLYGNTLTYNGTSGIFNSYGYSSNGGYSYFDTSVSNTSFDSGGGGLQCFISVGVNGNNEIPIGSIFSTGIAFMIGIYTGNTIFHHYYDSNLGNPSAASTIDDNRAGNFSFTRIGSTSTFHVIGKYGNMLTKSYGKSELPTQNPSYKSTISIGSSDLIIGQRNLYSTVGCASILNNMSSINLQAYHTLINNLMTKLGRNYKTSIPTDIFSPPSNGLAIPLGGATDLTPANDFIAVAGLSNPIHINAIKRLVYWLQITKLWDKIKCLYPFIGGNSTSHSFNLKDTSSFQLTYMNTINHSTSGIAGNGTNSYIKTGFIPSVNLSLTSNSMFIYSITNNTPIQDDSCDIGTIANSLMSSQLISLRGTVSKNTFITRLNGNPSFTISNTDAKGFYIANRNGTSATAFKNGTRIINATGNGTSLSPNEIYICSSNLNGTVYTTGYTNQTYALAGMGDGLTEEEALGLSQIINDYQTFLGRNVY